MENYGYEYIHKPHQFVTTLISTNSCPIDWKSQDVENSNFLSIFYSLTLRKYRNTKVKIRDRVHISKYVWPFWKSYKSQFTQEVFGIVAIATRKPNTYTIKYDQG